MFEELIEKVAIELKAHNIEYMIIGGQAVLIYGEPRLTNDIDVTVGINHNELERMLKVSESLTLNPIVEDTEAFVKKTMVLPLETRDTKIRIDFIFSFTDYERNAISRAVDVRILNTNVKFASLEDLVIHKIFAGRPRDIEDIKTLLLKNPSFDKEYIKKWLKTIDESHKGELTFLFTEILNNIENPK